MSKNEHVEQNQWFPELEHDDDGNPLLKDGCQQKFEHELFRALTLAQEHNKHPIIRCTEGVFMDYMHKEHGHINGSCWSVYTFRGIAIALRGDSETPRVVEVLDQTGEWSTTFTVERKKNV